MGGMDGASQQNLIPLYVVAITTWTFQGQFSKMLVTDSRISSICSDGLDCSRELYWVGGGF